MDKRTLKEYRKKLEIVQFRRIKPYAVRNRIVGLGIFSIIAGIYAYSILSVRQEDFLDEEFDRKSK